VKRLAGLLLLSLLLVSGLGSVTHAADPPSDFSLQVTPSPLVATVKPGTKTQLELKIRNGGSDTENLKIEPRSFSLNSNSTQVNLQDTTPPDISSWIGFSAPKFTVQPGQWFSEQVILNVPKTAGFSYSFALVISRQSDPQPTNGGRLIRGSLAVFTLVNVDRPGATSNLEVKDFSATKKVYEYLPATFTVRFRNNGNTIAQPYGNIFVQRSTNSTAPYATLAVNEAKGYILPGTERTVTATWKDGFPAYRAITNPDGTISYKLVWNWGDLSKLRIGRYTAHLVAVYSQAGRDTPIDGEVTFWVIPWKILLVLLVLVLLILFALFMLCRMVIRAFMRKRAKRQAKKNPSEKPADTPEKE
jgi:archaellum component FlaF (FlaF/FlaG flagellin family)